MRVEPDFLEILATLSRHRVDFIVCGGIAAILHGAPLVTFDLDVVYDASEENCGRLLGATRELRATYLRSRGSYHRSGRAEAPEPAHAPVDTVRGRLDLMREIGAALGYPSLVDRVEMFELAGATVRVLDLAAIIESKEAAGRPKDLVSLPFLYALRREKENG